MYDELMQPVINYGFIFVSLIEQHGYARARKASSNVKAVFGQQVETHLIARVAGTERGEKQFAG